MQELDAPLYNAVKKASAAKARFCMPSHSGSADGKLFSSCAFDYTEVEGLDNLACPSGVILEAEKKAAKARGCAHTLFVTEGSTVCMHVALSIAKERGAVGCIGGMHKSFYGGCELLGITPVRFESVADFLENGLKTQTVSSVFYTSPDYFGNVTDDKELLDKCRRAGVLTVTDAAHGAHFCYSSLLPEAAAGRADIAFCSTHKTMAVYTGGALIDLKDDTLYDKAVYYRQLWHTTSPSYLVMASTDYACALWEKDGEKFYADISAARESFEKRSQGAQYTVEKSDDLSRLVLRFKDFDAGEANAYLAAKGVYAEAAIGDRLIFILTPFNADKLGMLSEVLADFVPSKKYIEFLPPAREKAQTRGEITFVPVNEGVGRVCMNDVGFYPPGTPFIVKGEIFTQEDADIIAKNVGCTFGLVNGKLVVLQ